MKAEAGAVGGTGLTDEEGAALTTARDIRFELEGYEHAYDATIRDVRFKKLVIGFLSFIAAISFLYLRYVVKSEGTTEAAKTVHTMLGHIGTAVSLSVMFMTIWGHMAKWDGQLEKKLELSRMARRLVTDVEKLINQLPVEKEGLLKLKEKRAEFDEARKHELATLPQWAMQQAHQHVAMKYPEARIKCKVCDRVWAPAFAKRRRWVKFVPFLPCERCGV